MSKQDGIGTWVWNDTFNVSYFDSAVGGSSDDLRFDFTSNGTDFYRVVFENDIVTYFAVDGFSDVEVYDGSLDGWNYVNSSYRTIDIKTAPPAEFLTILQANATYQEAKVTDLTGTTWKWNETIQKLNGNFSVNFNFSYGEAVHEGTSISDDNTNLYYTEMGEESPPLPAFEIEVDVYNYSNNSWNNGISLEISFTGGTDATNQTLIDYLYANATLQESAPTTKYPITTTLEHCTKIGGDSEIEQGGTASITVQVDNNYILRSDKVVVSNANFVSLTGGTGGTYQINFDNPTGNVNVSAVATTQQYPVTYNLTHCTKLDGAETADKGGSLYVSVKCDQYFALGLSNVSVSGATIDRIVNEPDPSGQDVGQYGIYISNVTGDVVVTITAVQTSYTVTYDLHNCSTFAENPTVVVKGNTYTVDIRADEQFLLLNENIVVTGATRGAVTRSGRTYTFTISDFTANVTIRCVATTAMVGVTINLAHCSAIGELPTQAEKYFGFSFQVQCENKYHVSESNVVVVGADVDTVTDLSNGRYSIAITNVTSAVTVTVDPLFVPTNIYTYTFKDIDGSNVLVLENQEGLVGITLNYIESNKRAYAILRFNDDTASDQNFKVTTKDGYDFKGLATSPTAQAPTILLGNNSFIANRDVTFYPFYVKRSEPPVTTNLQLNVYQNSAEANRVDKTNYLLYIKTLNGTFREETNLLDMSIIVQDELPNYNYIYIPQLKRYYFIDDITSIRYNLWELHMTVDVLMTYKDGVRQLKAFVDRNEHSTNNDIIDPKRVVEQGYDVEDNAVENSLFTTPHSFVLTGFALKANDTVTASVASIEENTDKGVE